MTQTKTQQLNPQIFTVWSDKLVNSRLDCFYWMPNIFKQKLAASTFEIKKIQDVVESIKSGTTPKQSEDPFGESDYYFIRNTDLQDGYITLKRAKTIKPEIYEKYSALNLKKGDVLICIAGTIGISGVFDLDAKAIFNQNVSRLRFKKDVLPEYANLWFNSEAFLSLIYQNATQATIKYVNNDILGNLPIPLPPLSTQNKIVEIMTKAYQEKKEKEAEANKLLESIDTYVLDQLGIKAPEIKRDMIFEVMSDKVESNRIDPLYYSQKDIYSFLKGIKYKVQSVGDMSEYLQSGFAAGAKDQEDGGIIQIRPTNIDTQSHLKFDKNIFVKREYFKKRKNEILQKGEVLFNNTNSQELVGKTSFVDLNGDYFCSNHITRIKTNKDLNPQFLKLILNIYQKIGFFYNICTNWNNQSGVNINLLKKVKIPVPTLAIQNKIVEKINSYYSQAKKLKDEAHNNLQKAKEKVEEIILG